MKLVFENGKVQFTKDNRSEKLDPCHWVDCSELLDCSICPIGLDPYIVARTRMNEKEVLDFLEEKTK